MNCNEYKCSHCDQKAELLNGYLVPRLSRGIYRFYCEDCKREHKEEIDNLWTCDGCGENVGHAYAVVAGNLLCWACLQRASGTMSMFPDEQPVQKL